MALVQLFSPSEFTGAREKLWNKASPSDTTEVPVNRIVSGVAGFYSYGPLSITVNADGNVVKRRQCADTDFTCNFWDGDAILVANGPKATETAEDAPLRLVFSQGIRAVGAWVAVSPKMATDDGFVDQPLTALLLVRLASEPKVFQKLPLVQGVTGRPLDRGTPITAPFVGARTTGADRILEARFNASLIGNQKFDKLAVAELTFSL